MKLHEIAKDPAQAEKMGIEIPLFNRDEASASIVHIGIGRFHRAHQAVYVQELMNAGATDWGICGVCLLPQDQFIVEQFKAQDGYYTVVEQSQSEKNVKIIGSILDIIPGYENPGAVITKIADARTQILTLTVTEAGYFYHPASFELQWDHPVIAHDLQNPTEPKTIYGFILAALKQRRLIDAPLTIQSCDNIQGNGDILARLLRAFIERAEPELLSWVDSRVAFPNAMVDRITPAASDAEKQCLAELGLKDELAIIAEPFRQWVLETNFANERPIYESVGIQMTESVKPFEHMKVRLLNAGHSAIGYLGALAGFETIHEIVQNPVMAEFLSRFLKDAAFTVPAPDGVDLNSYQHTLVQRFSNPTLGDQTLRICKDGSAKVPGFLLPTLLELFELSTSGADLAVETGRSTESFALVLAAWYVFIGKELEAGRVLDDAASQQVTDLFRASDSISVFYKDESLFGGLAGHIDFLALVEQFSKQLQSKPILEVVSSLHSV